MLLKIIFYLKKIQGEAVATPFSILGVAETPPQPVGVVQPSPCSTTGNTDSNNLLWQHRILGLPSWRMESQSCANVHPFRVDIFGCI